MFAQRRSLATLEEFRKLRDELAPTEKLGKAVTVVVGQKQEQAMNDAASTKLLNASALRRQQFLKRKERHGDREAEVRRYRARARGRRSSGATATPCLCRRSRD